MARKRIKLTNTLVAELAPKEKPYSLVDTDVKGFMVTVRPSGKKAYHLSYRSPVDNTSRTVRIADAADTTAPKARKTADAWRGKIAEGKDPKLEKDEKRESAEKRKQQANATPMIGKFVQGAYGEWLKREQKTGGRTLAIIEREFIDLFQIRMDKLTEVSASLAAWRSKRLEQGISPKTLNRARNAISGAFTKAVEWGLIQKNPVSGFKRMKEDRRGRVRFLSETEEKNLRRVLGDRDTEKKDRRISYNRSLVDRGMGQLPAISHLRYADHLEPIVLLLLNTGARPGEMFQLTWDDVNFEHRIVTLRGESTKTVQTRHVPINHEAEQILRHWRKQVDGSDYVFPGSKNSHLTTVQKAWDKLITETGIRNFRFYDLRHTFASRLVQRGVPLNTVRELLGHSDMKMTLIYAHLCARDLADAVALLNSPKAGMAELRVVNE